MGIAARHVLPNNDPCFCPCSFAARCHQFNIKPIRTRIYTPRIDGEAERFIQTALREGPMPASTKIPPHALAELQPRLHSYN